MENKNNDDLKAIRSMMEQSSRFISLSGWSGVFAGIVALAAAGAAYFVLHGAIDYELGQNRNILMANLAIKLLVIALVTVALAFSGGVFFTLHKSKRKGVPVWNLTTRRLLIHLFVPLAVGAIFCLIFYIHHVSYLMGAATLVFYGLALLNASKYTLPDIAYLGYIEIVLGIIALLLPGYTLVFWALGFGVLHIIYGVVIQRKYD